MAVDGAADGAADAGFFVLLHGRRWAANDLHGRRWAELELRYFSSWFPHDLLHG